MTTPRVTEVPLRLEPTAHDPFLDDVRSAEPGLRELDHRRNDGIDVRMLWNSIDDRVVVEVSDARTGEAFALQVEAEDALDAFHHPYAHAALRGAA